MAIETKCPNCGQEYNLADSQVGKTVSCRSCREPFTVREPDRPGRGRDDAHDRPRRGQDHDYDDGRRRGDDQEGRPRRRGGRDDDYDDRRRRDDDHDGRPRRRRRYEDDDLDEELPRRGSGGGSWLPLIIGLGVGGGVLLLGLVVVLILCLPSGPRPELVTRENLNKCKLGMKEREVVAILGPGKDVSGELGPGAGKLQIQGFGIQLAKKLEWRGNGHRIAMILAGDEVFQIEHDF